MEYIGIIIVSAVLVEAVVTALKPIWDEDRHFDVNELTPLGIGVLISLATGLDIASAVGVVIGWPILPEVITGIIISRGANYVYDLVSKLN